MKRLLLLLLLLLCVPGSNLAQPQGLLPNMGHPLLRGIKHWWRPVPGRTGSATWYDLVPGSLTHLALTNMAYSPTSGWSGGTRPFSLQQLNFDGTDDYATGGSQTDFVNDSDPLTICAWLNPTTVATGNQMLLAANDGTSTFTGILWWWANAGSYPIFRVGDNAGFAQDIAWTGPTVPVAGVWQHWCVTRTGVSQASGMSMYLNGVAQTTSTANNSAFTAPYPVVPWTLGARCCSTIDSYFQGAMDDVMIWGRAFSASEIQDLYGQSSRGSPDLLPGPALMPMLPDLLAAAGAVSGATTWGVPPSQQSPSILNRGHALLRGQTDWWKAMPGFTSMGNLYPWPNLLTFNGLKLNNMGTGMVTDRSTGWALGTARPGGYAEMAFEGTISSLYSENASSPTAFTQPISVCVWARPDVSNRTLMELLSSQLGASPYDGVRFALGDGLGGDFNTPYLQVIDTTTKIIGVRGPSDTTSGAWHHYCGTYDGSGTAAGITVYTDGQALTPTIAFNDAGGATLTNRVWYVGTNVGGGNLFQGAMDDIRLWSRTLSAAEVRWVYLESRQGDPALFVAPGVGGLPVAAVAPGQFLPFFR